MPLNKGSEGLVMVELVYMVLPGTSTGLAVAAYDNDGLVLMLKTTPVSVSPWVGVGAPMFFRISVSVLGLVDVFRENIAAPDTVVAGCSALGPDPAHVRAGLTGGSDNAGELPSAIPTAAIPIIKGNLGKDASDLAGAGVPWLCSKPFTTLKPCIDSSRSASARRVGLAGQVITGILALITLFLY